MIDAIAEKLFDPRFMGTVLAAVAAAATAYAVAQPFLETDRLGKRMKLVSDEREQILQMFVVAILVSIGLSLVLASTIANPLSDLAAAARAASRAAWSATHV